MKNGHRSRARVLIASQSISDPPKIQILDSRLDLSFVVSVNCNK